MENVISFVCYDRVSNSLGIMSVVPYEGTDTIGTLTFGDRVYALLISKKGKKSVQVEVVNQDRNLDIAFIGEL